MKLTLPSPLAVSFFLCLSCAEVSAQRGSSPANVGAIVPDFEFARLFGHDGRTRLVELRGTPILIVGWRTHLVDGLHAGYEATQLHKKYGDQLIVIAEDRTPWRGQGVEASRAGFWITVAGMVPWLTTNPAQQAKDIPVQRSSPKDDRSMILIGVDGTLLAEGRAEEIRAKRTSRDFRQKIGALLAAEIKKRKKGWGDEPWQRKARALAFGKDRLAKAFDQLPDGTESEPLRAELDRHVKARLRSIAFMLQKGRAGEAKRLLEKLQGSTRGHANWEAELQPFLDELETKEGKHELRLDRKLSRIVDPILASPKGKVKPAQLIALRAFAKKHAGTRPGQRAARIDPLVRDVLAARLGLRVQQLEERAAR